MDRIVKIKDGPELTPAELGFAASAAAAACGRLRGGILPSKAAIFDSPAAVHLSRKKTLMRFSGTVVRRRLKLEKKFVFFFVDSDGEGAEEGKIAARLYNRRSLSMKLSGCARPF